MTNGDTPKAVSRRTFIKGVIAGSAAVASANYLFRASTFLGQQPQQPGSSTRVHHQKLQAKG
ncbi:MAG TPA: hypothetical protein VE135_14405 [Pyrinomonadaceae bacterium]|nr:hypothetical protein [Pyrinomonadaceae bacterium]